MAIQDQDPALLARESLRMRGDLLTFAMRISHDLRTPLGGIVASNEALKEMLAEHNLSTKMADSLTDSVEEISNLLKRVSFMARASAIPQPKQPVVMQEIVFGVLQRLDRRIRTQQATVTEPRSWPQIQGVGPWLEVIWWNLLANSLQHAGKAPRIELGWRAEEEKIKFWVADNGGGVPKKYHSKLFQPFDSLHELGSAGGLGLPIVQRLVDLQDGRCGYESSPAGGACFFFIL